MITHLPNHPDIFPKSLWYRPQDIGVHLKTLPLIQHRQSLTASLDDIAGGCLQDKEKLPLLIQRVK